MKLLKIILLITIYAIFFNSAFADKDIGQEIQKLAQKGDMHSQYTLGIGYVTGHGITKNYTKAFEWLSKAAVQGHTPAQYNLGVMYANGDGVTQSNAKAIQWFKKASAQGHAETKVVLAENFGIY